MAITITGQRLPFSTSRIARQDDKLLEDFIKSCQTPSFHLNKLDLESQTTGSNH